MFNCLLTMKVLGLHCRQLLDGKKKRASLLVSFFFSFFFFLSCDPQIPRSSRTPLRDPGDETAVPAPGGFIPSMLVYVVADRRRETH